MSETPDISKVKVPLADAQAALERFLGFDGARIRTLSRELQNRGLLAVGSARQAPEVDLHDVMTIVMGLAVDASLRETPNIIDEIDKAIIELDDLKREGLPPDLPPEIEAKIGIRAGYQLDIVASLLALRSPDYARAVIEITYAPWREIAFKYPDGAIERFRRQGAAPGHWEARGFRRSIEINGSALGDALASLFVQGASDAAA